MKKLNPKQQRFVEEYLLDLNATQAAIRAGYAKSTADKKAPAWVAKSREQSTCLEIWDAVNAAKEERSKETKIDAAWLLKRLSIIADFNINKFLTVDKQGTAYYDFTNATDDDWYCISEYTSDQIFKGSGEDKYEVDRVKLKTLDRMKALEMIGRHIGVKAFADKVEVEITDRSSIIAKARQRAAKRDD